MILGSGTGPPSLQSRHHSLLMVQTSEMASSMPRETRNLIVDPDGVQACFGLATDFTDNVSVGAIRKSKKELLRAFRRMCSFLGTPSI